MVKDIMFSFGIRDLNHSTLCNPICSSIGTHIDMLFILLKFLTHANFKSEKFSFSMPNENQLTEVSIWQFSIARLIPIEIKGDPN